MNKIIFVLLPFMYAGIFIVSYYIFKFCDRLPSIITKSFTRRNKNESI